jgi:hypothetical protein
MTTTPESYSFWDGAATMTYYVDWQAIVVQGWSMDPTKFQNNFWDSVREWFNAKQQTSVMVAGIVHRSSSWQTFANKLMGTDMIKKPVQQHIKLLVPQVIPQAPEDMGIARY